VAAFGVFWEATFSSTQRAKPASLGPSLKRGQSTGIYARLLTTGGCRTLATQVAKEVDDEANRPEVRQLSRNGKEEKENIVVTMPSFTIYDTNYDFLFEQQAYLCQGLRQYRHLGLHYNNFSLVHRLQNHPHEVI
jgi:hypothetical protein